MNEIRRGGPACPPEQNLIPQDLVFMQRALVLAKTASEQNEIPIGAVLVLENEIIGEGFNSPIALSDPTAHAEILALRAGAQTLKNYRLPNTTLYVTLEPCAMCAYAMIHARIKRLVFAAKDAKTGAAGSVINIFDEPWNHRVDVTSGLLAAESTALLQSFFKTLRG